MRQQLLTQAKRVVVKVGSSLIASRDHGLRNERLERICSELSAVKQHGKDLLLVTSGAIVSGLKKLGLNSYPKNLPVKQAAAAVGQSRLMWAYEQAFERSGQHVAQILLTHQDLADRRRFLNARHTLTTLLSFGVVPIINENDTVAVDEIRFGDNDTLAGQVAHLVDADLLVILSDVDGLFTADPRRHPDASLIPEISEVTEEIQRLAGDSSTFEGTGGMMTKVRAAKKVAEYGVSTLLLNGQTEGLLGRILGGADGGSFFHPHSQRLSSRKHWIAFTLRPRGSVVLDPGAVEALVARGKSLLASGILTVEGDFEAGDAVACRNAQGREIAKGLVNYSAVVLTRIKGMKTADIRNSLGQPEYEEVIHRDNLVILR
ncbi:glutamate 5-kinase [Nitrospira sp.]|nr:glutamate 5-kinase [Nitrospira sp.]